MPITRMRGITKGFSFLKMCRYQDARNSFAQAADIDPGFTEAWSNKGIALISLGKYVEAIRAFDKVIALNPNDSEARQQRDLAQKKIMESCSSTRSLLPVTDSDEQVIPVTQQAPVHESPVRTVPHR